MFEMHLAHLYEDLHNLQKLLEFMGSSKAFDFAFYLFFYFEKFIFETWKYILNLKVLTFEELSHCKFSSG